MLGKFGALLIATVSIVGACSPRSFNNQGDVASQQNANGKSADKIVNVSFQCQSEDPTSSDLNYIVAFAQATWTSGSSLPKIDPIQIREFFGASKDAYYVQCAMGVRPQSGLSNDVCNSISSTDLQANVGQKLSVTMQSAQPSALKLQGAVLKFFDPALFILGSNVNGQLMKHGPGVEGRMPQNDDPNFLTGQMTISGLNLLEGQQSGVSADSHYTCVLFNRQTR